MKMPGMTGRAQASGGEAGPGPAKKVMVKTSKDQEEIARMQDLVMLLSKLMLSTALSCRVLRAIVIRCTCIKTESVWHTDHKAGRTEYIEKQNKAKTEGTTNDQFKDACGIPSVWATNNMILRFLTFKKAEADKLQALADATNSTAETQKEAKEANEELLLMNESLVAWETHGAWKLIHRDIPHNVISKMFQSGTKRLEISCPTEQMVERDWDGQMLHVDRKAFYRPAHFMIRIRAMIMEQGGREMEGIAPPGDLERKIQTHIDSMDDT